jgi:hypothetical protein
MRTDDASLDPMKPMRSLAVTSAAAAAAYYHARSPYGRET